MNRRLVDTCTFSYIFKGDTRANIYEPLLHNCEACISFMTVAELYRWSIVRKWGDKQIQALKRELASYTILDFDDETAWL